VLLVCHDHARGTRPSPQLLAALAEIPEAMRTTSAQGGNLERAAVELVEAAALAAWEGETFSATVIERREATESENGDGAPTRVEVQLTDPPVTAWVPMDAEVGTTVRVRLESVDAASRRVVFVAADGPGA
jgi:exoribonuclease R